MRAIFTVVGAALFLMIFGALVALMMALFSNYVNTMQTVQQQQQQLSKLQQQLQQRLVGWINTSTIDTRAQINATVYNVGLLVVNLTSILLIWPNNTATPIENLTYTVSFTPPACGSSSTIDGKLTIELQPACRADINIKASVDSETAKYINLTRVIAIGYTFTTGLLVSTPVSTTLQLQHYKLTKTTTLPPTTTIPTPKLQLAKRHAIAWDTFDTDPFTEEKLYILYAGIWYRGGDTSCNWSWGWSNGKIWLNTTASARAGGSTSSSYISVALSVAINLTKYNPAYPEINETIADKVFIIANVTMLNKINIALGVPHDKGEVGTKEYLVFSDTTSPDSSYYALGGWNHTDTKGNTYEVLTILAIFPNEEVDVRIVSQRRLPPTTLLTNRTVTMEALYDSQNAGNPLSVCVIVDQTSRECLSSSDEHNIFPATAGFQTSTWVSVEAHGGSVSAEGHTNVSVDWFVLSLDATPEYINITGLDAGWSVDLYDGDRLVASAVAGGDGVARLFVAFHSIVVEPRVVVRDSDGNLVDDIRLGEVMVGGDVWTFSLG